MRRKGEAREMDRQTDALVAGWVRACYGHAEGKVAALRLKE